MRRIAMTGVVGGVAAATFVSGVAVAATKHPAAARACVTAHGALELLVKGKCAKGSKTITLGATGPTGARGPAGQPGVTGPAGPSDSYTNEILSYGGGASGPIVQYRAATLITHAVVPTGSYLVTADVQFAGPQSINDNIACDLEYVTSQGILQGREANISIFAQYPGYDDLSVHEPVNLPSGADVQLHCEKINNNTQTTQVADATLIAQKVGTLHAAGDLPKVVG